MGGREGRTRGRMEGREGFHGEGWRNLVKGKDARDRGISGGRTEGT